MTVKVGSEEEGRKVLANKKKLKGGDLDREGFNIEGKENKVEVKANSG